MDSNLTIIWLCYSMGTDFRRLLAVKYKLTYCATSNRLCENL